MILVILVFALMAGVVFFQVREGMFSAMIMMILSILCAILAFGLYEPVSSLLIESLGRGGEYTQGMVLLLMFAVPLIALRFAIDTLIPNNVDFGVWADRIGGGVLGLVTGLVAVGVLTTGMQMLPFNASIMGYRPYSPGLEPAQSLAPFYPDRFAVGLAEATSAGAFRASPPKPLTDRHDHLLRDLFCWRNTAGKNGRIDAPTESLANAIWYLPAESDWLEEVPDYPPLDGTPLVKTVVVRADVTSAAQEIGDSPAKGWWFLPGTHFRLMTDANTSYYPVAYRRYDGVNWHFRAAPVEDGTVQITQLILQHKPVGSQDLVRPYWVYRIPDRETPKRLFFRRTAFQWIKEKSEDEAMHTALASFPVSDPEEKEALQRVRELLDKEGPEALGRPDSNGRAPIHKAALNGHTAVVAFCLANGVDVNLKARTTNQAGETPLHLAAAGGHLETAKLLINRGATPAARDKYGNTPLHNAALYDRAEVADLLMDNGVSPNVTGNSQATPLHFAAARGKTRVLSRLMGRNRQANPNATTANGATPADCAKAYGMDNAIRALERRNGKTTGAAPEDFQWMNIDTGPGMFN